MSPSEMKVLLVDDFGTIRSVLRLELGRLGFKLLDEAVDGSEALEKIKAATAAGAPYTIIISDWNMPKMTGIELLEILQADATYKAIPFVMITAESEMNSVMRAIRAGASDYLVKPISPDAISKKIQSLLQKMGNKAA